MENKENYLVLNKNKPNKNKYFIIRKEIPYGTMVEKINSVFRDPNTIIRRLIRVEETFVIN